MIFTDKLKLTACMCIFGTVGLFVKLIPMPSSVIACFRGLCGAVFLFFVCLITHRKIDRSALKKNLPLLCFSGAAVGINWILLFEAYRFTTVATATLCYYMAPVFIILFSPLVLKEKITAKKLFCVFASLFGMLLVSGVINEGSPADLKGVLLGLSAAAVYASVIFMNKKIKDTPALDKTLIQLLSAGAAVFPYCLLTVSPEQLSFEARGLILLAVLGIIHTGFAYCLYFGAVSSVKAQTVAVLSYIDPALAVILSAAVLREKLDIYGIMGALLIIGAALFSELPVQKKKTAE